jgi:hypothetical protein
LPEFSFVSLPTLPQAVFFGLHSLLPGIQETRVFGTREEALKMHANGMKMGDFKIGFVHVLFDPDKAASEPPMSSGVFQLLRPFLNVYPCSNISDWPSTVTHSCRNYLSFLSSPSTYRMVSGSRKVFMRSQAALGMGRIAGCWSPSLFAIRFAGCRPGHYECHQRL